MNENISKSLWKEKYTALEVASSDLSWHVQVGLTVPLGSGWSFCPCVNSLLDWGIGEFRGQVRASGALCYVLECFLSWEAFCGVAEHQDWSVPRRLPDADDLIIAVPVVCQRFASSVHPPAVLPALQPQNPPAFLSLILPSVMHACSAQPDPVEDVPAIILILEAGNHLGQSIVSPSSAPKFVLCAHCNVLWVKQFLSSLLLSINLCMHIKLTAIVFPVYMETEAGPKYARADFGLPHSAPDSNWKHGFRVNIWLSPVNRNQVKVKIATPNKGYLKVTFFFPSSRKEAVVTQPSGAQFSLQKHPAVWLAEKEHAPFEAPDPQASNYNYLCPRWCFNLPPEDIKSSHRPTVPHCLQSFDQTVVIVISVSQFDTEEGQFDRIFNIICGVYTGQGSDTAAERLRSEVRVRPQLLAAATVVRSSHAVPGLTLKEGSLKVF